jgi:hypothetical protein
LLPTWASGARCLFGGETGLVLRHLIEHEGVRTAVVVTDEANGGFVEDRRSSAEPVSIDGAEFVASRPRRPAWPAFSSAVNADVFVAAGHRHRLSVMRAIDGSRMTSAATA